MSASKKKVTPKGKKVPARKKAGPKVSKPKAVKATVTPKEKPKSAAPKAKKVVEKKKESPPKVSVKAEPVVLGPPPEATIASRHIDSLHERSARGFSFGELASAGVPLNAAKRQGVSLDIRRRSVVEGNVEALKGWFKSPAGKSVSRTEAVEVPAVTKKK